MEKTIGYIGLGKMGYNMCLRLQEKGWNVVAYNRSYAKTQQLAAESGVTATETIAQLIAQLPEQKLIWIMVPWSVVDDVLAQLMPHLAAGDVVIDGGNSPYAESIRRGKELAEHEIAFLDVGVSGGPDGARNGACVMVGGEQDVFDAHDGLFADISTTQGYGYMGQHGAGHFVKMVHNGIEYGMMQAIAEGFSLMNASDMELNVQEIARVYQRESVITSRLVGWLEQAYAQHGNDLTGVPAVAQGTGEGEWTVSAAQKLGIPATVIEHALKARQLSEDHPNYQAQVIMALRNQFGGHSLKPGVKT